MEWCRFGCSKGGCFGLQRPQGDPIADQQPANLTQRIALNTARSGEDATVIMRDLADEPRLVANYGEGEWVKMQYVLRGRDSNVVVHWFRNLGTGENREYKFK